MTDEWLNRFENVEMYRDDAIRSMLDGNLLCCNGCVYRYEEGNLLLFICTPKSCLDNDAPIWKKTNLPTSNTWALYTPPKKKVKMWQWVIILNTCEFPKTTEYFYSSEEELMKAFGKEIKTVVQCADWTEIEV